MTVEMNFGSVHIRTVGQTVDRMWFVFLGEGYKAFSQSYLKVDS